MLPQPLCGVWEGHLGQLQGQSAEAPPLSATPSPDRDFRPLEPEEPVLELGPLCEVCYSRQTDRTNTLAPSGPISGRRCDDP